MSRWLPKPLADPDRSQIFITIHNPLLAGLMPLRSLRYVHVDEAKARALLSVGDDTFFKVRNALGVIAGNNLRLFVAVEGLHNEQFFMNISTMLHRHDASKYPDLANAVDDGRLIFLIGGGGNLKHWVHRMEKLFKPEWHLYDRDIGDLSKDRQVKADKVNRNGPPCSARLTAKREMENYIHPAAIEQAYAAIGIKGLAVSFTGQCDVPLIVSEGLHN